MLVRESDVIGKRYRLDRMIGHGGMGEVWRAQDTTLERPVAIKILSGRKVEKQDEQAFFREARIAAAVRHRNVVDVLDYGTHTNGAPYIVMELLEGENLGDVFYNRGKLNFGEMVRIMVGSLGGLGAAHDAGIVHRDLKPENIFLTRDRDSIYPKLLDFGISKSLDAERPSPLVTQEGRVVGTPAYMSPEQARGLRNIDHRSDLYSMGVILFEGLAGEPPFFDENPGDLMVKIITEKTPRLDDRIPGLSRPLADFVERAMHRSPERRFQSADAMRADLEQLARQVSPDDVQALSSRAPPRSWRHSQPPSALPNATVGATLSERTIADVRPATHRPDGFRPTVPMLVAGAVVVLAVAGLAVFSLASKRDAQLPYVIKVQPTAQAPAAPPAFGEGEQAEPVEEVQAPGTAQAVAPAEAEAEEAKPTRGKPRPPRAKRTTKPARATQPDSLTGRFRSQQAGIVRCLEGAKTADNGELSIRFSIDRAGNVAEAVVLPAELANSATGQCIQTAAKRIKFGPQKESLKFRIPLRTRTL